MSNKKERHPALKNSRTQTTGIILGGNRIDLHNGTNQTRGPFEYEAHCFNELSKNPNNEGSLLIGPGFIDQIIAREMPSLSRPDVIRLDVSSDEFWTLTQFFEIKSGKTIGSLKKVLGFSVLLRKMRERPNYLQELLQHHLEDFDFEVNRIIIPPDNEITVTFVSPNLYNGVIFDQDTPKFHVEHLQIPL